MRFKAHVASAGLPSISKRIHERETLADAIDAIGHMLKCGHGRARFDGQAAFKWLSLDASTSAVRGIGEVDETCAAGKAMAKALKDKRRLYWHLAWKGGAHCHTAKECEERHWPLDVATVNTERFFLLGVDCVTDNAAIYNISETDDYRVDEWTRLVEPQIIDETTDAKARIILKLPLGEEMSIRCPVSKVPKDGAIVECDGKKFEIICIHKDGIYRDGFLAHVLPFDPDDATAASSKAEDDKAPLTAEGIEHGPQSHIAPEFRLPMLPVMARAPTDDAYKPPTAEDIAKDFDLPR